MNPGFWLGKRVLLTGHTGFKGGWLGLWLHQLGARVTGFALPPPTTPSLFEVAHIGEMLDSVIGDIRDGAAVDAVFARSNPQIVFHLAAQPLVSEGYEDPVGTYATNVMGTLNILQAARRAPELQAMVVITTDKCYENGESLHPYVETDPLGGHDPYSSSKACTDIAVSSWRRSFFDLPDQAGLATARAGNVIGGGDWAKNRLVPDLLRAFAAGEAAQLRHIQAVRPWQHVLEPLAGYLQLAEKLSADKSFATAWNFGPATEDCVSVQQVADQLCALWPGEARYLTEPSSLPHEAGLLLLNARRAQQLLQWRPRWRLAEALRHTADWQLAWLNGSSMQDFCRQQINLYQQTAA